MGNNNKKESGWGRIVDKRRREKGDWQNGRFTRSSDVHSSKDADSGAGANAVHSLITSLKP